MPRGLLLPWLLRQIQSLDFLDTMSIFLALVHFPCLNRRGEVVATALTNVDIHDLARSGRTFGTAGVYIVTPIDLQLRMIEEILGHWTEGQGAKHERRAEAMRRVRGVPSLQGAAEDIEKRTGTPPLWVVTGAQMQTPSVSFANLRKQLRENDRPVLLVFGTGWGLAPEVIERADLRLPPISRDPDLVDLDSPYNHLSVRAAVAIALDRLLGDR